MRLFDKLERKYGKYAIHNLMGYVVFANAITFILFLMNPLILQSLAMDRDLVLKGQVWRIITFTFIPPDTNIIFIFFALSVEYLIGASLERAWGSFKFNCYFFLGMFAIILGSFLTGFPGTNYYLSLSLFFAFARIYPDFEFMLFFVLPVKVKYLALISWILLALSFIVNSIDFKIVVIISLLNFFVFFGKDIVFRRKTSAKNYVRKKSYQNKMSTAKDSFHKCCICQRTEKDDPNLEFRYCSKCNGEYEYCSEHLFSHEHK